MDINFYRNLSNVFLGLVMSEDFSLIHSETRNEIVSEIRNFVYSDEIGKRFWVVLDNNILRPTSEFDYGLIAAKNADTQIAIGVETAFSGPILHIYKVD